MTRFFAAALLLMIAAPAARAQDGPDVPFEAAYRAWDRGDYVPALEGFARLLASRGGERYLERIALITGELYHTTEVASDGRGVRFAPDGRWAAYETGAGADRVTRIVRVEQGAREAAAVRGGALAFAPVGDRAAYLRVRETPELAQARAGLDRAVRQGDRQAIFRQRDAVLYHEARAAEVVVRDLGTGKERVLDDGGLLKVALAWGADGRTIYVVGAKDGERHSAIYALTEGNTPVAVSRGERSYTDPIAVQGGRHLVYRAVARSPIPEKPSAETLVRGSASPEEQVVILDLETGEERAFPGSSPTVAVNGSAVAWQRGDSRIEWLSLGRADARPATAVESPHPVAGPALSPDGARVIYQARPGDDWELFVAELGGAPRRLTEEVQHDLYPRFLTPDRVLAVMGEGRHRRSYLYDVETGERQRLFHNNTVRTIAPEYEWAASADGSRVLIVAERDGDTVSPERGVYLMELGRKVTNDEVLARLRTSLAAEKELRARGRRMFEPIAAAVRQAVAGVSPTRLYEYQKTLHAFGSKYITQPGNRKAIEYLASTLKGWGYEPELQWFEPRPGVRTANVIATLKGTADPELVYVVSSHFDSVERGPGADDNTSGTSMLLETARILKDTPFPATVVFAFFTGEEAGLLGSREYVRRAVEGGVKIVGALNNDMMGYANDHRLDNTIRYSNPGIRDLQHAAAFLFSDLVTYDALYYKSTDAHAYYEVYGDIVGGIGSYPVLGNPHYHQATDRLETISQELMQETTKTNIASIMLLASSPARLKGVEVVRRDGKTAELRWPAAPENAVRSYVIAYGPASEPLRHTITVTGPNATISGIEPGMVVSVKAVGDRGVEGWDWAKVTIAK